MTIHLLVRMFPDEDYSDDDIRERFKFCYGFGRKLLDGQIPYFRERWSDLSKFMKDVKLGFTRFFNKRHDHKGYFWGDRFKSVIVEDGDALINCLAYIDLNPVRAGLVERPEDYRWSSIGWHVQTGNRGGFLSSDFGLEEYGELRDSERLTKYRRFLYETGALEREKGAVLNLEIVDKERKNDYELSPILSGMIIAIKKIHQPSFYPCTFVKYVYNILAWKNQETQHLPRVIRLSLIPSQYRFRKTT